MSFKSDDVIKWKHFPRYWPFVRGIHRSPVNSPHKSQRRGALMFPLISAWTNTWANHEDAGDFRRHRVHHDVTVMTEYLESISDALRLWLDCCSNNTSCSNRGAFKMHSSLFEVHRDDVIRWKHFPRYWPFVWGIRRSTVNLKQASDAELWCFLWSAPE